MPHIDIKPGQSRPQSFGRTSRPFNMKIVLARAALWFGVTAVLLGLIAVVTSALGVVPAVMTVTWIGLSIAAGSAVILFIFDQVDDPIVSTACFSACLFGLPIGVTLGGKIGGAFGVGLGALLGGWVVCALAAGACHLMTAMHRRIDRSFGP